MGKRKLVWASAHEMTDEQRLSLEGEGEILYLKGIQDNVEHSQSITSNQIQAIKNIQNGLYDGRNE